MTGEEIVARGRKAWPRVRVRDAAFAAFAADLDLAAVRHPEDLYLAFACASGDPAALEAFSGDILAQVPRYVARVAGAPGIADEIRQTLAEKLFVAAPRPKLLDYAGRGPLGGWVRVAAIRAAIDLLRARGERVGVRGDMAEKVISGDGVEVGVLKTRYQHEFQQALDAGVAGLSGKQRLLLKMHIVDGVTLDELARSQRVHRATVARWIAAARDELVTSVEARLRERLRLSASEYASVAALVQSRLHLSVARMTPDDSTT